jgi:hypothetical protein
LHRSIAAGVSVIAALVGASFLVDLTALMLADITALPLIFTEERNMAICFY